MVITRLWGQVKVPGSLLVSTGGSILESAEVLGSVSAFANAAGGDILIGVKADSGLPIELPGLDPGEVDSEMLRIRQVIGTSVEPHLLLHFHVVPLPTGRSVLIIRVPRRTAYNDHGCRRALGVSEQYASEELQG